MSILAPSSDFVFDVGSLCPLKIGRQKEGPWLRPAYQRPKRRRVECPWSQSCYSLGERSPKVIGLRAAVVKSECGHSGVAVGHIQHPLRICVTRDDVRETRELLPEISVSNSILYVARFPQGRPLLKP